MPIVGIVRRGEYATTTFCKQVQLQWWVKNPPYGAYCPYFTGAHREAPKPIVGIVRRGEYATATFCK